MSHGVALKAGTGFRTQCHQKFNITGIAYIEFSFNKTNPEISGSSSEGHQPHSQGFSPICKRKVLGTRLQRHQRDETFFTRISPTFFKCVVRNPSSVPTEVLPTLNNLKILNSAQEENQGKRFMLCVFSVLSDMGS